MWYRGPGALINLRQAASIYVAGHDSNQSGDFRVVARIDSHYEPTLFRGSRSACEAVVDQLSASLAAASTVAPSKASAKPASNSPAPKPVDRGLRTGR
jgi:hypothetical protein